MVSVAVNAVERNQVGRKLAGGTGRVIYAAATEQIGSGRRKVPDELTRNLRSPSARSIPSWKELKVKHWVGECGKR
jgi:hypothetical protein